MEYIGTTGKIYKVLEPAVGKGGEGSVYRISNMPDYVLKVFLEAKRTETRHKKLLAMLSTPLSAEAMKQITWPIDVVYENGDFVGYVMPAIKNNEALNVMYSDKYTCSLFDKITIAKNLCAAINSVHEANQVCGDLNPKNIIVDPRCAIVTLIDTDSYQITETDGSRVYRCEVGMPEYLPREIQKKIKNGQNLSTAPLPTFTKQSDLFALAVHIFALLMNGCHPFACAIDNRQNINHLSISKVSVVAPQPIDNICSGFFPFYDKKPGITTPKYAPTFDYLPENMQDMFVRAFVKGHTNPSLRPTAVEWYNALTTMQGELKICRKEKQHMYPEHNNSCPWCAVNAVLNDVKLPSGFTSGAITQTSIKGTQHFATPQNQNVGSSNSTSFPVGKIIIISICVIIVFFVFKNCFSSDNSDYSYGDEYYSGAISSNEYDNNEHYSSNDDTDGTTPTNEDDNNNDDYTQEATDDNSASQNTQQSENQTITQSLEQLKIEKTEKKTTSVNAIIAKQSSGVNVDFINHYGNISTEDQIDEYTYSVINGGRARIEISGLQNRAVVALYIYNSAGEQVSYDSYCTNNEGITLNNVEPGQLYKIQVRQKSDYSSYTLTIGQPKAQIDITNITKITDSIEFDGQRNVYSFTVPRDGVYRFEMSGITSGCVVELYVFNDLGESLNSDKHCTNSEGVTLKLLKAGETYSITVGHSSGYSGYVLSIGKQKPIVDISNLTKVNDSIEYTDQRNIYSFKPAEDGRYRFEIEGLKNGCDLELYVLNSLDEVLGSDMFCANGEGVTLQNLSANETYEVQVRQKSDACPYILNIGNQKPTNRIGINMVVCDSIEYTDQRNIYVFTAEESGTYTFIMSGLNSGCTVGLYAFNELGETVKSDRCCMNGEKITLKNITAGEIYEIQVCHSSGVSDYQLTIE